MDIRAKSLRTLANGKTLDDLIRRDTREVSIEVLTNAELYQWELENLFVVGWNLLGHESEIPDPNDYVVRPMGEDQVIVARDRQGEIHVTLNVCRQTLAVQGTGHAATSASNTRRSSASKSPRIGPAAARCSPAFPRTIPSGSGGRPIMPP